MEPVRINKSTSLSAAALDEATLEKINRFTLEPLTAEQVFTFKATLCDTRIDRDGERFTAAALGQMKELFVGRTTIKDHMMSAENQIARIYDTELVRSGDDTELIAYCYMVRTSGNADLIAEISGGIKKEGSVSCAVSQRVCSICGKNNLQTPCRHIAGKEYDGELCCKLLDGVEDVMDDIADVLLQGFLFLAFIEICDHCAERLDFRARFSVVDVKTHEVVIVISADKLVFKLLAFDFRSFQLRFILLSELLKRLCVFLHSDLDRSALQLCDASLQLFDAGILISSLARELGNEALIVVDLSIQLSDFLLIFHEAAVLLFDLLALLFGIIAPSLCAAFCVFKCSFRLFVLVLQRVDLSLEITDCHALDIGDLLALLFVDLSQQIQLLNANLLKIGSLLPIERGDCCIFLPLPARDADFLLAVILEGGISDLLVQLALFHLIESFADFPHRLLCCLSIGDDGACQSDRPAVIVRNDNLCRHLRNDIRFRLRSFCNRAACFQEHSGIVCAPFFHHALRDDLSLNAIVIVQTLEPDAFTVLLAVFSPKFSGEVFVITVECIVNKDLRIRRERAQLFICQLFAECFRAVAVIEKITVRPVILKRIETQRVLFQREEVTGMPQHISVHFDCRGSIALDILLSCAEVTVPAAEIHHACVAFVTDTVNPAKMKPPVRLCTVIADDQTADILMQLIPCERCRLDVVLADFVSAHVFEDAFVLQRLFDCLHIRCGNLINTMLIIHLSNEMIDRADIRQILLQPVVHLDIKVKFFNIH